MPMVKTKRMVIRMMRRGTAFCLFFVCVFLLFLFFCFVFWFLFVCFVLLFFFWGGGGVA